MQVWLAATQETVGIGGPGFLRLLFAVFFVVGVGCGYMSFARQVLEHRKIHFLRRVGMRIFMLAAAAFLVAAITANLTLANAALLCIAAIGAGYFLALVGVLLGWSKGVRSILHKLRRPRPL